MLSAQAGIQHGFFGRQGGVSTGAWSSLNCGDNTGDLDAKVATNRARVAACFGLTPDRLCLLRQVHGCRVVHLDQAPPPDQIEADALVTTQTHLALAIKTADCVPMLVVAPGLAVAAVHGGWRGLAAGICEATARALVDLGAPAKDLRVAIGPHIGPCCYPVGDEVIDALGEVARAPRGSGLIHADLGAAARTRWLAVGVAKAHVDLVGDCVCCQAQRSFSYRRDRGHSGRNLSVILRGGGDK